MARVRTVDGPRRVRRKMSATAGRNSSDGPEKLFGRYHELALLLISLLFTSIAGGYLTFYYQQRSWTYKREAELRESERNAASKVFEEISALMDRRLYRMRRILWGYQSGTTGKEMNERWTVYREALFEWNERLNTNLAFTQRYFGDDLRMRIEVDIQFDFIELNQVLERLRSSEDKVDLDEFRSFLAKADLLNNKIYLMDVRMIEMIQLGTVGAFLGQGSQETTTASLEHEPEDGFSNPCGSADEAIALLVDVSGSIRPPNLDRVIMGFMETLEARGGVGIFAFGERVRTLLPIGGHERGAIYQALEELEPNQRFSDYEAGVKTAVGALRDSMCRSKRMILITDGLHDMDIPGSHATQRSRPDDRLSDLLRDIDLEVAVTAGGDFSRVSSQWPMARRVWDFSGKGF